VRRLVRFFWSEKSVTAAEVALHFVSSRKMAALHGKFFGKRTVTDCMSFPLGEDHLGEIVICPKAALSYAPDAPYEELSLYLIHGLLHLMGYDDQTSRGRAAMEREQERLLSLAKKKRCLITSS
jgi:probable rRNA maturation factor